MDSERWQKTEELFHAALELEPSRRAEFLSQACDGDESLREEIESLLSHEQKAGGFVEAAVKEEADSVSREQPDVSDGKRIGAYKVIRQIGRGGMGTVYLATREDDYKKRVAIKLIRRGMDTEDILRRFRNERQILASLNHDSIARLLDGGMTDDGLPYVVMEYVEGKPINNYCDAEKLSTVKRLKLFRRVCSAVHYAHQNLVVHRDLKPSNIIVTAEGAPKLLDFGIAKLLNPEMSGQTIAPTATAIRLMTPEYASPEQVRGDQITTASDVYSLGVVLYELLSGHRPYHVRGSAPQEIVRAVCEQEPEKPSTIVSRVEEVHESSGASIRLTPQSVSLTREAQPDKLRRQLSGDLDNIVLMAMRKEARRRYASVEQLSEDLRRHLEGLPVMARKDTFAYRAEKLIKRNKAAVAVALLVVALVAGFVGITLVQSRRIAHERDNASRERDKSARERDKAERVSAFLQDIFKVSDPSESRGNTVTAREILDKGAERVAQELKDQPEVQATLMDTIGVTYTGLGLYDRARSLLEEALKIRSRVLGNEHADVARTMMNLVQVLGEQDELAAAEALTHEALAIRRKLYGNEHAEIADCLNDLAYLSRAKGNTETAETLYREALAMRRRVLGNEDLYTLSSLSNLAVLLYDKRDLAAAEPLYREAIQALRKNYGNDHPDVALTLNNLGSLLREKGDIDASETAHREALAIRRKLYGDEHADVSMSLHNLASVLKEKGELAEAEALMRKSLSTKRGLLPEGHRSIATSLTLLGDILVERGNAREAEGLLREALKINHKALPKNDWRIPGTASILGGCLTSLRRYSEAEPLLIESYHAMKANRGAEKRIVEVLNRVIELYEAWNKPEKLAEYRALAARPGR